jgi:hypothetical protein
MKDMFHMLSSADYLEQNAVPEELLVVQHDHHHSTSHSEDDYDSITSITPLQCNSADLPATSVSKHSSNDDDVKIAFITYSHMSDIAQFNETVLGAANTWLPADATYYVVLNRRWEATFNQWKQTICDNMEKESGIEESIGVARIQPIYVDCPEAKFGESPCCKQQHGLVNFYKTYYREFGNYDWVMLCMSMPEYCKILSRFCLRDYRTKKNTLSQVTRTPCYF